MKKEIEKTNRPWVPWPVLKKNQEKILGEGKKSRDMIWSVMEDHTFTFTKDKTPKSENPKIYEYRFGATELYVPVKILELYLKSDENKK